MTDEFALEPSVPRGEIPERVIGELRTARRTAKDYARAYSDAAKAQAGKYGVNERALKRFIAALEDDKVGELDAEAQALERLIGTE